MLSDKSMKYLSHIRSKSVFEKGDTTNSATRIESGLDDFFESSNMVHEKITTSPFKRKINDDHSTLQSTAANILGLTPNTFANRSRSVLRTHIDHSLLETPNPLKNKQFVSHRSIMESKSNLALTIKRKK